VCVCVYVFVGPQLRNVWVKQNRTHSRGQQYIRNLSDFDFFALSRGFRVCSLLVYLSVFYFLFLSFFGYFFFRGFMTTFLFPFPPGLLRKAFPADTYPLFIQNLNHEIVTRNAFSFHIRPYTLFTYVPSKPHARQLNGFLSEKLLLYYCVYMHYATVHRRLKQRYRFVRNFRSISFISSPD
jgi:hypothetical protein